MTSPSGELIYQTTVLNDMLVSVGQVYSLARDLLNTFLESLDCRGMIRIFASPRLWRNIRMMDRATLVYLFYFCLMFMTQVSDC